LNVSAAAQVKFAGCMLNQLTEYELKNLSPKLLFGIHVKNSAWQQLKIPCMKFPTLVTTCDVTSYAMFPAERRSFVLFNFPTKVQKLNIEVSC
jgi:hypothetical protein